MKSNILSYIIVPLLATAILSACTDYVYPASPEDGEGKLIINYSCTGLQTRTEDPWGSPWYEMKIYRLDLFLFDGTGKLLHHFGNPFDAGSTDTFPTDLTAKEVNDLDPATCYLIANCPSVADKTSLAELQAAVINPGSGDAELVYNGKQTCFVMTAMITKEDIDHGPGHNGKDVTMRFELKRVAVKIVLEINGGRSSELDDLDISYKMYNYATGAKVLPPTYDDNGNYLEDAKTDWLETTPEMTELNSGSANYHPLVDYPSFGEIAFYSYPTDWFDTGKVQEKPDGTYIVDLSEPPVVEYENGESGECYIMLKARWPKESGNYYHYKIPVNYRFPDDIDNTTFTKDEYWTLRDFYRLKRNHVYRIDVTIGIEGGVINDPVKPQLNIKIDDWSGTEGDDRIPVDIPFDEFK